MATESSLEETPTWRKEQRRRELTRLGVWALVVFSMINAWLNYASIADRRAIHEAEQVTGDRLAARAEIHITMLAAYSENLRPLTDAEKDRIISLWQQAKYPENMQPFIERIQKTTSTPEVGR